MVRPQMEFSSVVWDPCYNVDVDKLEKIQRRAARWVISDYNRTSSVTQILNQLSWPTLRTRRKISRLQLLHKILHQDISLSISPYCQSVERQTRHYHPLHFILPKPSTTSYQQSFYSRSIKEWNELPVFIIEMTNYDEFATNLISHFTNNQYHIS